ncbi:MAG: PIN domain nuclease [Chloroflexi bacterium]|nr:PIN domain nuclease [Chloroflexota bacterium]MYE38669.1 PIN domain nuclease [Chloroflexota bacterium]
MVILTQSDRPAPLTLADSSAWIEFLRNTGSLVCLRLHDLLRAENVATCDAVRMEVLAGARDDLQLATVSRALDQATVIPMQSTDYDTAAALYRRCRRQGETVRKLLDCLIAAVAIRAGIPVLHNDRDFDVLARHTELQTDRPES